MSAAADSIRERMARREKIARDEIAAWMTVNDDLELWSAVDRALGTGYSQIDPEPGMGLHVRSRSGTCCGAFVRTRRRSTFIPGMKLPTRWRGA